VKVHERYIIWFTRMPAILSWHLKWPPIGTDPDKSIKTVLYNAKSARNFSSAWLENVCNHRRGKLRHGWQWSLELPRKKNPCLTLNSDNIFTLHAECRHKGSCDGLAEASHAATDNRIGYSPPPDLASWIPDHLPQATDANWPR